MKLNYCLAIDIADTRWIRQRKRLHQSHECRHKQFPSALDTAYDQWRSESHYNPVYPGVTVGHSRDLRFS